MNIEFPLRNKILVVLSSVTKITNLLTFQVLMSRGLKIQPSLNGENHLQQISPSFMCHLFSMNNFQCLLSKYQDLIGFANEDQLLGCSREQSIIVWLVGHKAQPGPMST